MNRRTTGVALALTTALVSGVSVYVNGRAVKHFGDATVYTTAKNGVAGLLLVALALVPVRGDAARFRLGPRRLGRVVLVAIVGGSVPFVLFFEGLARAEATQAGFIQKTLVVWVALLAVPLLRERFGWAHALSIVLLLAGQAWLVGHAGTIAFGSGEAMILAATLLWAVEVVYVKHLLRELPPHVLAACRMALGTGILLAWVAVGGRFGQLASLSAEQWRWVVLTGLLLTAYVATWYAALARAQAVDVTAVLVLGAVVTATLSGAVDGAAVSAAGIALVTAGAAVAAALALRRRAPVPAR